jgi:hypothetical protein
MVAAGFRFPVAAQVGRNNLKVFSQFRNLFPEKKGTGRKAMNQHNRFSGAVNLIMQTDAVIRCKKRHRITSLIAFGLAPPVKAISLQSRAILQKARRPGC